VEARVLKSLGLSLLGPMNKSANICSAFERIQMNIYTTFCQLVLVLGLICFKMQLTKFVGFVTTHSAHCTHVGLCCVW